jgi:hypothetical protein
MNRPVYYRHNERVHLAATGRFLERFLGKISKNGPLRKYMDIKMPHDDVKTTHFDSIRTEEREVA